MASHGPSLWSLCPGQISSIMALCPPAGHMMRRPGMATFRFFSMARIHWVILSRCGEWGLKWFKTLKKTTCRRTTFFTFLMWKARAPGLWHVLTRNHMLNQQFSIRRNCPSSRGTWSLPVSRAATPFPRRGRVTEDVWRSVLSLVGWWKLKLAIYGYITIVIQPPSQIFTTIGSWW